MNNTTKWFITMVISTAIAAGAKQFQLTNGNSVNSTVLVVGGIVCAIGSLFGCAIAYFDGN